jgi:hypothetical protein
MSRSEAVRGPFDARFTNELEGSFCTVLLEPRDCLRDTVRAMDNAISVGRPLSRPDTTSAFLGAPQLASIESTPMSLPEMSVEQFQTRADVFCTLAMPGGPARLPEHAETDVYRILQGALSNLPRTHALQRSVLS